MEEMTKKLGQYIAEERKSHESERMVVADLLEDLLDDHGSADLMITSMESLIGAAASAIVEIRKTGDAIRAEERRTGGEILKRFRVEYSVRHFNGAVEVLETNSSEAEEQVLDGLSTDELITMSVDSAVDMECIYEVDDAGKEIPGTREEIE